MKLVCHTLRYTEQDAEGNDEVEGVRAVGRHLNEQRCAQRDGRPQDRCHQHHTFASNTIADVAPQNLGHHVAPEKG